MYIDVLRHLRDVVGRKCPEKWRTNIWFLLHDNAPTHQSVLVKEFLAKNNVTILELPQYLVPTNLYLFPELKSALKGRHFCYATDNMKNAMEELKRLAQRDCFEGDVD